MVRDFRCNQSVCTVKTFSFASEETQLKLTWTKWYLLAYIVGRSGVDACLHSQIWGLNPIPCFLHSTRSTPFPSLCSCTLSSRVGCFFLVVVSGFPFFRLNHPSGIETISHPMRVEPFLGRSLMGFSLEHKSILGWSVFPGQCVWPSTRPRAWWGQSHCAHKRLHILSPVPQSLTQPHEKGTMTLGIL